MRTGFCKLLFGSVALSATVGQAALAGEITIYSSLEEEEITRFVDQASQDIPDITLNILRLSTGNLTARLVAEADNPQADVVLSLPVTNMLNPAIYNSLVTYEPEEVEKIPSQFRDSDGRWFSLAGYMEVFCANTDRLASLDLPVPTSWEELVDPKYKGEVVMPDPVSSGVGFVNISTLVTGLGEEKGWDMIERLTKNIAQYVNSGSRPCRMAQSGEYAIGVSYEVPAIQAINEGYPLQMVIPSDIAGYEISGNAMLKGSDNIRDTETFLDWLLTPASLEIFADLKPVTTVPRETASEAAQKAGLPNDLSTVLSPVDFAAMAEKREAIMKRWAEITGR